MRLKITFSLAVLFTATAPAFAETCPYPATAAQASVATQVTKNADGTYSYMYSVTALPSSKRTINFFNIRNSETPLHVESPADWQYVSSGQKAKSYTIWLGNAFKEDGVIKQGNTKSGFNLKSKRRPGITQATLRGRSGISENSYSKVPREENTACPGFWDDGTSGTRDPFVTTLAIGPLPDSTVAPEILIKRTDSKLWSGFVSQPAAELVTISPIEKTEVQVLVLGDADIDVEKIDLASLRFGRGQAKPVKTTIVSDLAGAKVAQSGPQQKAGTKNLLLSFKTEDVNVLCDLDGALLLTGKLRDGRDLSTGVKNAFSLCTPENFQKEVPKINNNRPADQKVKSAPF